MTINTRFEQSQDNTPCTVRLHGKGVGAATSSLTSQKGLTFTRTGVGIHTVTLPTKFSGLLNVMGTVVSTTAANWHVHVNTDAVASAGTLTITILSAAADHTNAPKATDLSTSETLFLDVVVQDTATKPAGF